MDDKTRKNNIIAFWLAMISSFLLFISGTTGVSSWLKIEDVVLKYVNFEFIYVIFFLLLIVASFGGIAVFIAGIFILKEKAFLGDLFILLGTGAGLMGFLFNLIISVSTSNFSIYTYLTYSTAGLLFAFTAQYFSNKKKIIMWFNKLKKLFKRK